MWLSPLSLVSPDCSRRDVVAFALSSCRGELIDEICLFVLRDTQLLRALDLIVGLRKAVDLLAMVRHRNLK
jgi:hypothetical protein